MLPLSSECNDEFKVLVANPSPIFAAGWDDAELSYKLERCIYTFFMGGLSVFDSFAYCLYFLGEAIEPAAFPNVANPRKITRKGTADAFSTAFQGVPLTTLLVGLSSDLKFKTLDELRNILAHRLSGGRSIRASYTKHEDGTHTTDFFEETWHVPGTAGGLTFDGEMLQRHLDDVTALLTALTTAAREFAESHHKPAKGTTA